MILLPKRVNRSPRPRLVRQMQAGPTDVGLAGRPSLNRALRHAAVAPAGSCLEWRRPFGQGLSEPSSRIDQAMTHLRNLLTMSVLAGLVLISCAAAVQVARRGLPDLKSDDHSQLREQLTSMDLTEAPEETVLSLARHLEQELRRGVDWQAEIDALDEQQRERFESNLSVAMWAWFQDRLDAYYECKEDEEREEYLRDQVDRFVGWRAIDQLLPTSGKTDDQLAAVLGGLIKNVVERLAQEPAARQQQIVEFLRELRPFIEKRAAERMVPGGL